jgi:ribosomal protein L21
MLKIMKNFGIREDMPRSKKHLDYETLNLKSKRILNRVVFYLELKNLTIDDFLKDIVLRATVKTKSKTEKVETMKAEAFFNLLYDAEIITQNKVNENLC